MPDAITYGLPEGCLNEDANGTQCDYYLALSPNVEDGEYFFHLEGIADGWVAVGFSLDKQMVAS